MNAIAAPVVRACASVRARLGQSGSVPWRQLRLAALLFFLAKGMAWIVVGYIALGR